MATRTAELRSTEIRPLTSVRFIAALLVFIHHYIGISYGQRGENFLQALGIEGHVGVSIFFVLSGFFITYRYFIDPDGKRVELRTYFIKRIARIYPLYFFLLFLIFVSNGQHIGALFDSPTLVAFTLTQGYFMALRFTTIRTAWSLTVEESFYLFAPLLFALYFWLLKRGLGRTLIVFGLFLAVFVWLLMQLGYVLMDVSFRTGLAIPYGFMSDSNPNVVFIYAFFFRFSEFAIGIFGAYIYYYVLKPQIWKLPLSAIGATLASILSVIGMGLAMPG